MTSKLCPLHPSSMTNMCKPPSGGSPLDWAERRTPVPSLCPSPLSPGSESLQNHSIPKAPPRFRTLEFYLKEFQNKRHDLKKFKSKPHTTVVLGHLLQDGWKRDRWISWAVAHCHTSFPVQCVWDTMTIDNTPRSIACRKWKSVSRMNVYPRENKTLPFHWPKWKDWSSQGLFSSQGKDSVLDLIMN